MISLSNRLLGRERDRAYNQRVIVTPAAVNLLSLCYFFPLGGGGGGGGGAYLLFSPYWGLFLPCEGLFSPCGGPLLLFSPFERGLFKLAPPPPHLYEINAGSHAG